MSFLTILKRRSRPDAGASTAQLGASQSQSTPPGQTAKRATGLAAVVGTVAAGILLTMVPEHEGVVLRGYLDPIGIPTKCMGDTNDVVVGREYTMEECTESMNEQLVAHAEPVMRCVPALDPEIPGHGKIIAAYVDLAYNIGTTGFCRSSVARLANQGRWEASCNFLTRYVYAGGRVFRGLVRRRNAEKAICLEGMREAGLS